MNICEPQIVFLTVVNDDEAALNKSKKALERALMSANAKFEMTWVTPIRVRPAQAGFQKWLAVKCTASDTMDVWKVISDATWNDPSVAKCTKSEFVDGGQQAREICSNCGDTCQCGQFFASTLGPRCHKLTTSRGVTYALGWMPRAFWWQVWKPKWHKGRGHQIRIGLWAVSLWRGY